MRVGGVGPFPLGALGPEIAVLGIGLTLVEEFHLVADDVATFLRAGYQYLHAVVVPQKVKDLRQVLKD